MLGNTEKVVIDKDNTTIVNGNGNKNNIKSRVNQIKSQIENTSSDYDRENFKKDWLLLEESQYYMLVPTEVEMKEKKDRVDDALSATRAAIEEGIVPWCSYSESS